MKNWAGSGKLEWICNKQTAQLFILPTVINKAKATAQLSTYGFCRPACRR